MDEGQAEDTVLQHARQNSIRSMTPQDILPSTVRRKIQVQHAMAMITTTTCLHIAVSS